MDSGTSDCGAHAVALPSVAAPAVPAATFKKFLLLVRIISIAPFVELYCDLAQKRLCNARATEAYPGCPERTASEAGAPSSIAS